MAIVAPIRERRFYPRAACELVDSKSQVIRNISQNGLLLESEREYPLSSEITLSFFVPPADVPLKLNGRIVRKQMFGNRYGYGVSFPGLEAEDLKHLQHFYLQQMVRPDTSFEKRPLRREQKVKYKTIVVETEQQNLTHYDPRLTQFLQPSDYFYLHDLTKELRYFVETSGITDGSLLIQIMHTSATLLVNELDEPMLLMDITQKLRSLVPKEAQYLHNSPMREVNLCADDSHCDRNGDAHVKASLFGQPSITLIIREGKLVLGPWQKIALLEFDGPRRREVLAQALGV